MKLVKNKAGDWTRRIHGLDTNERTIAEALKEVGYFTAIIGKWHAGEWLPEHLPMGQGFMHQYGHYAWGIDYNHYTIPHNSPATFAVYDWHRNQEPLFEQGYATDLFANEAVRLIAEHKKNNTENGDVKPFFIYVPFNAVHGPIDDIPRYTEQYTKREAALKCLDDAVGRIVGAIDQYGYGDDTLVIFANDNGGIRENMNAPYRGTKNTTYEGGVRVPCIMRWPNKIQPNTVNNQLMHIIDFYSTFLTLAGASLEQARDVDGMNMTDVIFENKQSMRDEVIYDVSGCVRLPTIRKGDYKLMGDELYNIVKDPSEKNNIAATHPGIVKTLKARLMKLGAERPPLGDMDLLMTPAQPWVYGQQENETAPGWLKEIVRSVRKTRNRSQVRQGMS
jgi:arylsulfatase A-like enzyme